MSQDAAWRGCVSQGISAPSLCGQAVVLLASSWVPPCRDPTRHSRASSVIRGLTSCPGDSRTSAALRRVWTTLRMSWQEQRTFSIRKTRSLPLGWPTGCEVSAGCGAEPVVTITEVVLSGAALGPFLPRGSPGLAGLALSRLSYQ